LRALKKAGRLFLRPGRIAIGGKNLADIFEWLSALGFNGRPIKGSQKNICRSAICENIYL